MEVLAAEDEKKEAQWSLSALAQAAKEAGSPVKRSPDSPDAPRVRACAGAGTHSWAEPRDQGLRPKRTAVVSHYVSPPAGSTTICTDELGPVVPRTFPPARGWAADGHRIKAPLDYLRGRELHLDLWRAARTRRKELTRCAPARNSKEYIALLAAIEADNPKGDLYLITDNLSSYNSLETRTWMEAIRVYITSLSPPERVGSTCRRAGGASSDTRPSLDELCQPQRDRPGAASCRQTAQPPRTPWVWGRTPKTPRRRRRLFCYRI